MTRRPVYVTGIGAVTPLAARWWSSVPALARGDSAVRRIEAFDTSGYPCTVGAPAPPLPGGDLERDRRLPLLRRAAAEALSGIDLARHAPTRRGVFIGAESGRAPVPAILALARAAGGGEHFDHARFGREAPALADRIDAVSVSPAAVAAQLAGSLDCLGPVRTISVACASGAAAIAAATRAVRLGQCDVAIAGGVGADLDPLMLVGFGKLGALSARGISRPFDVQRDGFVVGEGAAICVLSADGPHLGVRITGIGSSLDGHHLTAPDADGDGAIRAMRAALADAGDPAIDYVQAHGTSTPLNDEIEARAIDRVLGAQAGRARVASIKGAVGHWIAGAGAVGALCGVEAVRGLMLPTASLARPDPRCPGNHLAGEAVRASARAAMVNSFAFGGANCCLIMEPA